MREGSDMKKLTFIIILSMGILIAFASSPVYVKVSTGSDPSGANQLIFNLFNATHDNIKVVYDQGVWNTGNQHDTYVTYLSGRDSSLDIISLDIIWPPEFAAAGWLLPLDKYFSKEEIQEFLPGPIEGCTYKGHLYAIPWFTDAGMLYYRKDLLQKYGFEPPTTWDQLVKEAQYISEKEGIYGFVYQANQYEGLVCDVLEYIWGNGGRILKDDKVTVDTPNVIQAVQFMADLRNKYNIAPKDVITYQEEDARHVFQEGKAVFMRNWPYAWSLAQAGDSPVSGKIGICPMPRGPMGAKGAATLGGWNLGISAFSKHKKEAVEVIKFVTSYEAEVLKSVVGGNIPTRKAVYKDPIVLRFAPYYKDLYNVFINARPRPVSPIYPEISDKIQIYVHKVLAQEMTAKAAMEELQKQLENVLASY